jgi:hypothetical protein
LKVRKLLILPILALLLVGAGRLYAENKMTVHFSFQGITINTADNLLVKDNIKYVSLAFLKKQLRVTAVWHPGSDSVKIGEKYL